GAYSYDPNPTDDMDAGRDKETKFLSQYRLVYDTLMKYQWPMCIASFPEMSADEIKAITTQESQAAEESFLRAKIRAIDSKLDIVFIPDFLYQLFVVKYVRDFQGGTRLEHSNTSRNKDVITSIFGKNKYAMYDFDEATLGQIKNGSVTTKKALHEEYK